MTKIDGGHHIQTLTITEEKVATEITPLTAIYDCTSSDGVYPTIIFVPKRKVITEILAIQPSSLDNPDDKQKISYAIRVFSYEDGGCPRKRFKV